MFVNHQDFRTIGVMLRPSEPCYRQLSVSSSAHGGAIDFGLSNSLLYHRDTQQKFGVSLDGMFASGSISSSSMS